MNGKQHTVRGLCYGLFLLTAGLCLGWYCLDREVSWWILLVAAVLATWRKFRTVNTLAGWLLVPYLLWCSFALYLNVGFAVLN